jgi:hypothetical protein
MHILRELHRFHAGSLPELRRRVADPAAAESENGLTAQISPFLAAMRDGPVSFAVPEM